MDDNKFIKYAIIVLGSVATVESVIISIIVIIMLGVGCYRCKNKSTTTPA